MTCSRRYLWTVPVAPEKLAAASTAARRSVRRFADHPRHGKRVTDLAVSGEAFGYLQISGTVNNRAIWEVWRTCRLITGYIERRAGVKLTMQPLGKLPPHTNRGRRRGSQNAAHGVPDQS